MATKHATTRRGRPKGRTKAAQRAAARRALVGDVVGVALLVLGVLGGLGLYLDMAGPVGAGLAGLFRWLLGVFGVVLPPALLVGGAAVLAERRAGRGQTLAGAGIVAVGVLGLWHLVAGAPNWEAPPAALDAAGGRVGALVSVPLVQLAAPAGAGVLLVVASAAGVLVATGTTPREVAVWVADRVGRVRHAGQRAAQRRRDRSAARTVELAEPADAEPADGGPADGGPDREAAATPDPAGGTDAGATGPIMEGLDGREEAADDDEATETLLPAGVDVGGGSGAAGPVDEDYELPATESLRTGRVAAGNKRALDQMTRALEHTLRQFNVGAAVERVRRGPTVTRFELELGEGVRVNAVTKLSDDLAYALATPEIRIVAPIPGKSAIGIEVPNRERDLITLGDMLRSEEAGADPHPLTVGLGIDIGGHYVMANLAKMPHVLIAGATGSGKSVLMNAIVTSVLMRATPSQVQMVLIDPKRVELNHYAGVPHLLGQVITEPRRASEALEWVVAEMDQRYEMLSQQGHRNIEGWNTAVDRGDLDDPKDGTRLSAEKAAAAARGEDWRPPRLRYVLVVIDELADLMMVAPRDIESAIVRISQMARAVGIHLVVATQRPEVQVVTGLIKANVPSRIALSMATGHDSKTVLNSYGAEKLVGDGDMLFLHANASKPHRLQGCYVAEDEIERVVDHWRGQGHPQQVPDLTRHGEAATLADAQGDDASDHDLTRAAMELVVRSGLGSTSMLQRKLKVGFARAGRLMDELEELRVVGPSEGPKARDVLMTVEELEQQRDGGSGEG